MIFIFEDRFEIREQGTLAGYKGISYLLQFIYTDTDVQLIFAESNRLLKSKLIEAVSKRIEDEPIIIYMDLVADNKGTWGIFQKLVQVIMQNDYKSVYVIPIPSIEYAFICSIGYICADQDILQLMMKRALYRQEKIFVCSKYNKEGRRSFEKFTKVILEKGFRADIAHNRIKLKEYNFYNSTTNEFGRDISVCEKSWSVWKALRVFADPADNSDFGSGDINAVDVIQNEVGLFLDHVEMYIEERYIDRSHLNQFKSDYMRYMAFLK